MHHFHLLQLTQHLIANQEQLLQILHHQDLFFTTLQVLEEEFRKLLDKGAYFDYYCVQKVSKEMILMNTFTGKNVCNGKISVISMLYTYFARYGEIFTKPTRCKFIWLCISILAMYSVHSVKFLHDWFLCRVTGKSLNSFYYFLNTKMDLKSIMQTTVKIAISCIPEILKTLPVMIIIDDTLQAKFGVHFECYKSLFDHTKRNGSNYLNGHCFVGLILKIPLYFTDGGTYYLTVPIGFRLRKDDPEQKSKLKIAAEMIDWVMEILKDYKMVILFCDSWYPKGAVKKAVKRYKNLDLIASVRVDTVLYNESSSGKKKEDRVDIHNQEEFLYSEIGSYMIATRRVRTNLFGDDIIFATVTTTNLEKHDRYRLFISTLMPEELVMMIPVINEKILKKIPEDKLFTLLPFIMYSYRWTIEVVFYEQKKFWAFGRYMLRSATGIENYVNIMNICYSSTRLLPFLNKELSFLQGESAQHTKYFLGHCIYGELFYRNYGPNPEINETEESHRNPFIATYYSNKMEKCS